MWIIRGRSTTWGTGDGAVTVTDLRQAALERQSTAAPEPGGAVVVYVLGADADPEADREQLAALGASFPVVLVTADVHFAVDIAREIADGPGAAAPAPVAPVAEVAPVADLVVDPARHEATWLGDAVPLSRRERDILHCLLELPRRVWSHRELHERVWGGTYLGDPSLVHSALKRLRRKLRDSGVRLRIDAVRGVGFRLAPT